MRSIAAILTWEILAFLYVLAAVVVAQLLTGRINVRGLLSDKSGSGTVSPERIQLLLATIAASMRFISGLADSNQGTMPDIGSGWLFLFGASGGVYAISKALKTLGASPVGRKQR